MRTHRAPAPKNSSTSSSGHGPLAFFFRGFPRGRAAFSPRFFKEIRDFEEALSQEIEALRPRGDETLLCLPWMASALTLALEKHKEAVQLIPPLQFPLPRCDQAWMTDYMDQTTRMMDMCNALFVEISAIQQGNLLISHAIHTLRDMGDAVSAERASCALRSLREWLDSCQVSADSAKICTLLKQMFEGLVPPRERDIVKGKGFLYVLHGANVTVVVVLYALALFFLPSKEELLSVSVSLVLPEQILWSSSFSLLLHLAKEEVRKSIREGPCLNSLGDLCTLRRCVVDLFTILEPIDQKESSLNEVNVEQLKQAVEVLSRLLDNLAGQLDLVWKRLNDMFRTIVASRSALLDRLGDFGATDNL